jgi:putative oxidoreductase
MNHQLEPWQTTGLATLRIITGLLMAYHGLEVFDAAKIAEYSKWEMITPMPAPTLMVYLGKGLEFFTGICFVLGLFTRLAAVLMAINMLFICFKIGNGKFYYEDQHPFIFAMLAIVFFFTGPVKWSLDQVLFKRKRRVY